MADAWLLAEALRSVIRCADVFLLLLEGDERHALVEARDRVVRAVPDAVNVRDILEHFDDYLLGIGRKQRPGDSWSQAYDRRTKPEVRVGPFSVDVDLAEGAANHLASVVIVGRDHLGKLP